MATTSNGYLVGCLAEASAIPCPCGQALTC
jgi:hypothetical protein